MTDFDPETEIEALIETYGAGFDDYDPEAVTACFAYPAVIWQSGKGHVFADAEEMTENVDALFKAYEEAGIVTSAFDLRDLAISDDSAVATVDWEAEDGDGIVVMEFSASYHLIHRGDRWQIAMIVNAEVEGDEEEE